MKVNKLRQLVLPVALAALLAFPGCAKKVKVAQHVPPPPPPAAPTATLAASPDSVQQGQRTTLTWQTKYADDITLEGIGTVPASGSRQVTPSGSTTYTLLAKGPGGSKEASARVTVNPAPVAQAPMPTLAELFSRNVKDIFFDYDKYAVRSDEQAALQQNAKFLAAHPQIKFVVEGHCDERGSEEYNLALGDNRAESVRQELEQMGVPQNHIKIISYGKEKPFCTQDDAQCWSQNRRAHFALQNN